MHSTLLTLEQRALIARALPLREGFDLLSAQRSPDGKTVIAAVNDPVGPRHFAPGGFSHLARVRQQSFVVALELATGNVRFLEFDAVLRRVHVASDERVLCELGYPFSQWVTLWNPRDGKTIGRSLGSDGDDNLVVIAVDGAGKRALLGTYYRKEYNDTDSYLGITVVELAHGESLGEKLCDGSEYADRRGDKKVARVKRYGEYGPELVTASFVPDGVRVTLARVDRLALEHDVWTEDLQRFVREEAAPAVPATGARTRKTGARLGKGVGTGRWSEQGGKVTLSNGLRARKGESAAQRQARAALALVAGAELYFGSDEDAVSFALECVRAMRPRLRYAHVIREGSWHKTLAGAARFTRATARELVTHVAQRTHYETGYGAVLFRSGIKHATAWSSSVLVSGSTVCLTEPLTALADPASYLAKLVARVGARVLAGGSAGPRLAGLPCFDPAASQVARKVAQGWRGVDVGGATSVLNWLVALPPLDALGGTHALLEHLDAQLAPAVLQEKLPGYVTQSAQLRALPDARTLYRATLDALPTGATLHALPKGYLMQTTEAPLGPARGVGVTVFAPLRAAWQWLANTPMYAGDGRGALMMCADNYRHWFYTPAEAKAEGAQWQAEQTARWQQFAASRQQAVHTEGDFDAEFDADDLDV